MDNYIHHNLNFVETLLNYKSIFRKLKILRILIWFKSNPYRRKEIILYMILHIRECIFLETVQNFFLELNQIQYHIGIVYLDF